MCSMSNSRRTRRSATCPTTRSSSGSTARCKAWPIRRHAALRRLRRRCARARPWSPASTVERTPMKFLASLSSTLFAAVLFAAPALAQPSKATEALRIGYQKYGTLTLLKARGDLDKRLAAQGIAVQWTEFPAGPQLLEGLNVGSIDFGTVGEAPPIFAQAAGANLVCVANEPPAPAGEAIVVPKNSTLKSVAELKGKKVALNKGSNVHYLLAKALQ